MSPLGPPVFTKVYNYVECGQMPVTISLYHTLRILTMCHACKARITARTWSIITPVPTGYRVELFVEEDK